MNNLFWSVYLNLEDELLDLGKTIYLTDQSQQLSVYSMRIADLLVRTVIEIEALSKELYKQLGGDMHPKKSDGTERCLEFDRDCLKLLDEKWLISKKVVHTSGDIFHFANPENRTFYPIPMSVIKNGKGWNRAYQAVKHDRYNNLQRGSINYFINSLAALYLLNLYYADADYPENKFDPRCGSRVFSVNVANALSGMNYDVDDSWIHWEGDSRESSVYIMKMVDEDFRRWHLSYCVLIHELDKAIMASPELQKSANEDYFGTNVNEMLSIMSENRLWKNPLGNAAIEAKKILDNHSAKNVAVVNKNQSVYPKLSWEAAFPGEQRAVHI